MCLWNNHTIRNQRKRPNVVAGKPFLLYNYPELSGAVQCGMPADPAYVEEIREEVVDWGKQIPALSSGRKVLTT